MSILTLRWFSRPLDPGVSGHVGPVSLLGYSIGRCCSVGEAILDSHIRISLIEKTNHDVLIAIVH